MVIISAYCGSPFTPDFVQNLYDLAIAATPEHSQPNRKWSPNAYVPAAPAAVHEDPLGELRGALMVEGACLYDAKAKKFSDPGLELIRKLIFISKFCRVHGFCCFHDLDRFPPDQLFSQKGLHQYFHEEAESFKGRIIAWKTNNPQLLAPRLLGIKNDNDQWRSPIPIASFGSATVSATATVTATTTGTSTAEPSLQ